MNGRIRTWTVLRDPAPFRLPTADDAIGQVLAADRAAARRAAEQLFPRVPVVVAEVGTQLLATSTGRRP